MITIKAIDHVVLRTSRLQDMIHFYCEVLGCHEERRLADLGLVQLRAGTALIDLVDHASKLGQLGGRAPQQDGRNMDHVCLRIAAVSESALKEYLRSHDIGTEEFAERYGATGYGRSVYIEDPEGNVVELKLEQGEAG